MKVNNYIIEPKANLQGANLQGADLRGADLQDTNLYGAYLRGAYLQGAYLRGAYLRGADLRGAYLQGADLQGAYLQGAKGIISFTLGKHFGFSYKCKDIVYVQIGCEHHTLEHWLINVEAIGEANRYDAFEIECYKAQLNLIAVLEHRRQHGIRGIQR